MAFYKDLGKGKGGRGKRPQGGNRAERGERPQGDMNGDRSQGGGRTERGERFRPDRPERGERGDRPQGGYRGERNERFRPDRPERGEGFRSDRPDRPQGGYRSERPERGDGYRPDRPQGGFRSERGERFRPERPERGDGYRSDRPQGGYRSERPDRPQGGYRGERNERFRPDRPERGERGESYRPDRPQGGFRSERGERGDGYRSERPDRPQGGYRGERNERYRPDRPERGERGESYRPDRPQGGYRSERSERFRPERNYRSERGDRPQDNFRPAPAHERYEYRPDPAPIAPDPAPRAPRAVFRTAPVVARPVPPEEVVPPENLLVGRNPIREALRSGRDIEKLLVARGDLSGSAREIVAMARERRVVVQEVDKRRLDQLSPRHQGMAAFASAFQYRDIDDMLALARERGEAPLLVLLDGVTDPHNLGAIIRSAECAGAHGVVVPTHRSVGLTPAAVKASAGAVEYLPVARVANLSAAIDALKKDGVWVLAADAQGEPVAGVDFKGPLALVIGAEGEGVSRLVLSKCDRRVALPMRGKIASLNASVAAGVLLYEAMRRRAP